VFTSSVDFVVLNFFHHTSRPRSRELERLRLGLGPSTSRSRLGPLRLGSRLGLGLKGLVHIPVEVIHNAW